MSVLHRTKVNLQGSLLEFYLDCSCDTAITIVHGSSQKRPVAIVEFQVYSEFKLLHLTCHCLSQYPTIKDQVHCGL